MNSMKIVLFLMLIAVEYIGTEARKNKEHKFKGRRKCVREAQVPVDGQVFYMMHEGDEEWWYASHIDSLRNSPLNINELVDEDWPKWKWHDCGHGNVAIETLRYPGSYLRYCRCSGFYLQASVSPCSSWRNLFDPEIYTRDYSMFRSTDNSKRISFCSSSKYICTAYLKKAVIYIPPVCEEKMYTYFCNANTTSPSRVTLQYEYGISNSRRTKTGVTVAIQGEVFRGIVSSVGIGISASWSREVSRSMSELTTTRYTTEVPKGKMIKLVQNKVYYDKYSVQSKSITASEHDIDWRVCNS